MITLTSLASQYPRLYLFFILLFSLIVLIRSSDLLLFGITKWAKKLGISDYLIGLIVVALGASLPELVSALTGAVLKDGGIVFGTIIGSNIAGLTLLLGVVALITKKVYLKSKLFDKVKLIVLLFTMLPIFLVIDNKLGRIDGIILIFAYFTYVYFLWRKEGQLGSIKRDVKIKHIWRSGLIFILALAVLLLSGQFLIFSSIELSKMLGISSFIIATIVIGIGSQFPDLIVILKSETKGHEDVGIGDLLGSTITKSLLFFGVIAIANPISVNFLSILTSGIFLLISMCSLLIFMKKKSISRPGGILVIGIYIAYLLIEVLLI